MSRRGSDRELDDLILELKGLVHVRALLEDGGAPAAVLEAHGDAIDRARTRLAGLVRESADGIGAVGAAA